MATKVAANWDKMSRVQPGREDDNNGRHNFNPQEREFLDKN